MTYDLIPKDIIYDDEMHSKIEEGVKAVHDAVGRTMGKEGQRVMYEESNNIPYPVITKDGVSVASMIVFKDQIINNGAQFVIQAARKQVYETGDGTTLTSIMVYKIYKEGRKLIAAGHSQNEVIKGIKKGLDYVVKYIENTSKKDVDLRVLQDIAKVSTNYDFNISEKIAEAVFKTGKYGIVGKEKSNTEEHTIEYQDGYQLDIGIQAKEFINTDQNLMLLKNPYIIITDMTLSDATSLKELLTKIYIDYTDNKKGEGKVPIVIIAENIGGDVPQAIRRNITDPQGKFFITHIKPSINLQPEKNRFILEDIASCTGAFFMSKDSGYRFDNIGLDKIGTCEEVMSSFNKTLFRGFNENSTKKRIKFLDNEIKQNEDPLMKKYAEESIAKLTGGIAVIKVGSRNMTEQNEIFDRVDDAIRACKSSQEMGYVRGGGVAMLLAEKKLKDRYPNVGFQAFMNCLSYPAETILKNAKDESYQQKISNILKGESLGYEINNDSDIDMYEAGIIDPAKVIIYGLKNAVSSAISLLQTSVMIIREDLKPEGS